MTLSDDVKLLIELQLSGTQKLPEGQAATISQFIALIRYGLRQLDWLLMRGPIYLITHVLLWYNI